MLCLSNSGVRGLSGNRGITVQALVVVLLLMMMMMAVRVYAQVDPGIRGGSRDAGQPFAKGLTAGDLAFCE